MLTRRMLLASTAALIDMPCASALTAIGVAFAQPAFEAAQAAGRSIVIEIGASWCPVCRVQKPILEDLVMSDRFKDVVLFEVDFDRQKEVLRKFGASKQSTLIVFKGAHEVGRSIGEVKPAAIEALLAKAL